MSPPKPEERRRRYHKRSRNGCIDCKRKHIRCDEKKPLCTNCLVKGDSCGYAEAKETSSPPASIKVEEDDYWDSASTSMQSLAPSNLLVGQQVQVAGDPNFSYGNYSHGGEGDRMGDDTLSRQTYYWGHGMTHDSATCSAVDYTMGAQQMYNWRDVPSTDPTAGQPASYWSQDLSQGDEELAEAGRREGKKKLSRRDGGKSRS
ncbi:hypothetical protein DL767_006324 [Monosporascus sp. MG133]|nr:hypothetical protein DL767_006324 [Monosporascus sp. MG133]